MESRFSIPHNLQEERNLHLKENILVSDDGKTPKSKRRKHFPCEVGFLESVDGLVEPKSYMNFTWFSLEYVDHEEKTFKTDLFEPRFGGHQTLEEREKTFYVKNQTLHCGFVKGPPGYPSTGFDLNEKDKAYMFTCKVVVSSCIFGSSDFLRRPTSRLISHYSKDNVCFVMFLDDQTLSKLSLEGNSPDDRGYIGLWKIVIVKNLPYEDMRRTGKVPKFLSHRLFPNSRYSIWLDSKMRLNSDPMLIIEYFLWRRKAEYAISNHYDRHCVWEEVLQNKRLNKYNHTAIDEQFHFYQSDGLTKFDTSNPNNLLPSHVPEGSFIVRAHTPMSNLFSCLWFNEVDRFTSRDQLSFAYTYLKFRRTNPERPFHLYMFKDCERRALVKLFRHRAVPSPPDTA
ncbi:probable hexosyltransferase MUCI70 isoform X2 [Gastrolobium bilobum]|nr:probable hexosyltransferase MUCI70 isoform X2 [Gastrolobium bilobum]